MTVYNIQLVSTHICKLYECVYVLIYTHCIEVCCSQFDTMQCKLWAASERKLDDT